MRICVIGPASNVHVHRWTQALMEHGHRVSVLSTSPLPPRLPSHLAHAPMVVVPTARPGMSRRQRLARLWSGWARVPGLLASLQPDIVHVHSLPAPAATPFLLRVPRLLVSAWGTDVVWRDRRKERFYPLLLRHAQRVTATSRYLAGVVRSYLSTPRPIDVVAFGVDTERFSPPSKRPDAPRIGTVRHLEPKYGLDVLVRSVPALVAAQPAVEVDIVGEGEQRSDLERLIAALGTGDNVRLRGRLDHAHVPTFLGTLRVFANPSREEAFGVAALEAQACGVPVVASRVGALHEIVREGETGLLVPPDDPASLAAALSSLLQDEERARGMGRAARAWVLEHYRWERNVEQMLAIYREVEGGR
jgi:L-malate glycosyltransferase